MLISHGLSRCGSSCRGLLGGGGGQRVEKWGTSVVLSTINKLKAFTKKKKKIES